MAYASPNCIVYNTGIPAQNPLLEDNINVVTGKTSTKKQYISGFVISDTMSGLLNVLTNNTNHNFILNSKHYNYKSISSETLTIGKHKTFGILGLDYLQRKHRHKNIQTFSLLCYMRENYINFKNFKFPITKYGVDDADSSFALGQYAFTGIKEISKENPLDILWTNGYPQLFRDSSMTTNLERTNIKKSKFRYVFLWMF